jgi:diacylglycerol O-acyltransferase
MTGDHLTALETAFLQLDRAGAPLHIGSVSILDGDDLFDDAGAFRLEDLLALVTSRLDVLPQLRQRVRWPAGGLGRPWWEDAPDFDVADHVGVTVLAGGGREEELRRAAAELFARPLRSDRPLWDLRFLTGLPGGRVAVVQRVHHAIVDGVSGVELATMLFDTEPRHDPAPAVGGVPGVPAVPPTPSLAARAAAVVGGALDVVRHPARPVQTALAVANGLRTTATGGAFAPPTSLNVPIGPSRQLHWIRGNLDLVKGVARAHGVKGNDVVLTAVAGGVRQLLIARHEAIPPGATVRVLVPVSRHAATGVGRGNQVTALLVDLPIGIGDPAARLRAVAAETARLKASGEAEAGDLLLRAADLLPAVALGATGLVLTHQPLVNLVVTNVPGPPMPLYVLGARSLEAFPFVPIAGNLSLGVAVLSYDGSLNLGITVDPVACPDAHAFVDGVEASLADLEAAWTHHDETV